MEIHGTSKLSGLQIAVEEKLLNPVCSWVLHTRHESNLFHWQEVMTDVDWFLWNRPERRLNFVYTHQQKKKEHFWSFIWRSILVIVFQFSNFVAGILLKPIFKSHGKSYRNITNFFLVERFHELLRKLVTSRSSRWLVLCPQKMLKRFSARLLGGGPVSVPENTIQYWCTRNFVHCLSVTAENGICGKTSKYIRNPFALNAPFLYPLKTSKNGTK